MLLIVSAWFDVAPIPQLFSPRTLTIPVDALLVIETVILLVLEPLVIVTPDGTVQTYVVAPEIGGTINVIPLVPWHPDEGPVIVPAAAGVAGLTITSVVAVLVHPFNPVTVTEYEPAFNIETFVIEGFCNKETKPFCPAHW